MTLWPSNYIAYDLLDYPELFSRPIMAGFMRATDDPMILVGPLLQPLRGALFGLILYPFRDVVLGNEKGWLYAWGLFAVIGIVSPYGPAPGSLEGLVFTRIPLIGFV